MFAPSFNLAVTSQQNSSADPYSSIWEMKERKVKPSSLTHSAPAYLDVSGIDNDDNFVLPGTFEALGIKSDPRFISQDRRRGNTATSAAAPSSGITASASVSRDNDSSFEDWDKLQAEYPDTAFGSPLIIKGLIHFEPKKAATGDSDDASLPFMYLDEEIKLLRPINISNFQQASQLFQRSLFGTFQRRNHLTEVSEEIEKAFSGGFKVFLQKHSIQSPILQTDDSQDINIKIRAMALRMKCDPRATELFDLLDAYDGGTTSERAGLSCIEDYNRILDEQKPLRPDESIMDALVRALDFFHRTKLRASDTGFFVEEQAKKLFVHYLWYFNKEPRMIQMIKSKCTSHDLISTLSQTKQMLEMKSYGTGDPDDLAILLQQQRYVLVREPSSQHIWVNQSGIQVRVKKNSDPRFKHPHTGQFSVGLVQENPLEWDAFDVIRVKLHANNKYYVCDHENEIVKGIPGFIIPAFLSEQAWFKDFGEIKARNLIMAKAHLYIQHDKMQFEHVWDTYGRFEINSSRAFVPKQQSQANVGQASHKTSSGAKDNGKVKEKGNSSGVSTTKKKSVGASSLKQNSASRHKWQPDKSKPTEAQKGATKKKHKKSEA
jgi:hypothetical protein